MGLTDGIFKLFGYTKEEQKVQEPLDQKNRDKLTHDLMQMAMARDLYYGANLQKGASQESLTVSRDEELMRRLEMYSQPFVRECLKIIIARAIGVTHNGIKPYRIRVSEQAKANDKIIDLFQVELDHIENITENFIMPTALDSAAMGDGYSKVIFKEKVGVISLFRNFSLQPQNITPIVTNFGNEVGFEVSINTKNKMQSTHNTRKIVPVEYVARMNAESNGLEMIQSEQFVGAEKMNAFNDEETAYEDAIYGGVLEGCYDSFKTFMSALRALSESRQASATVERFISHYLGDYSENERKIIKEAFEVNLKKVRDDAKKRVANKSSEFIVANHVLPVVNESNKVEIQESTPRVEGLQTIEDIKYGLKMFMADMGFNIELTPFADNQVGGAEQDGFAQKSLQMDTQGAQVRKSITKYLEKIIKVHFKYKYSLDINLDMIDISYNSTVNRAKAEDEENLLNAVSNRQQMFAMVEQMKAMGFKDDEDSIKTIKRLIADIMPKSDLNIDDTLETIVNLIVTKKEEPQGGENESFK